VSTGLFASDVVNVSLQCTLLGCIGKNGGSVAVGDKGPSVRMEVHICSTD
jgi:hypothetical protein